MWALHTRAAVPECFLLPVLCNLAFPGFNQVPCPNFQPAGLDLNHHTVSGCASGKRRGRMSLTDNSGFWLFKDNQDIKAEESLRSAQEAATFPESTGNRESTGNEESTQEVGQAERNPGWARQQFPF